MRDCGSDLTAPRMTTPTAMGLTAPASTILFRIAMVLSVSSLNRLEDEIQDADLKLTGNDGGKERV